MIRRQSLFDGALGGGYGLIRVPLKPEDRGEPRTGRHPWIELEPDDMWVVYMSAAPRAARSCISRRRSRLAAGPRLWSACCTRPRHSSMSERCVHSGAAAIVKATPTAVSPLGENAQSRASRTLSM